MTTHGAKYGDARYLYGDTNRLYGLDAPTIELPNGAMQWVIMIDWTGNGFAGNEAVRCVGYHLKRGREYYVRAGAKDLEPMQYYSGTLTLDNSDYRYDPYNTSSPLYPNVRPGRKIYIAVKDLTSGITYLRMMGFVTNIQPVSGTDPQVTVTFYDGMKSLYDTALNMAIKTNTTVSQSIYDIITAAGYPFGAVIEPWLQPIPVFDGSDINAYDALSQLSTASLGTFFIDVRGHARYYPLNYSGMPTWTIDQADVLKEIATPQPWDVIRNDITVTAQRHGKAPMGVIYSMGSPVLIPHGGYASFDATWAQSVDVGSKKLHYASYSPTGVPGDANDITGWVTISLSKITATGCHVNAYKGDPTNPGFDGYLTYLDIYGCQLITTPYVCKARDDVSASPANYGPRRLEITNPFLQDAGYARAICNLLLEHLKNPHKLPTIQIDTRPDLQFSPDLMDKVHFTSAKLGIDDTFQVAGIEEEWKEPNGQSVLTTFYLHQVPYSTATITPDPYYPPAIPPVTPPTPLPEPIQPAPPPLPTPPPPYPDNDCRVVMPANGPDYVCGSRSLWSDDPNNNQTALAFPCYIRPGSAANKTTLSIEGTLTADTGGGQQAVANDGWEAYALLNGNVIAQAIKDAYTGSPGYGVRTCHFEPPSNAEITGFLIMARGALIYTPTGATMDWDMQGDPLVCSGYTPNKQTGLRVISDHYYCIETQNGPWFGNDDSVYGSASNYTWMAFNPTRIWTNPASNGGKMGWSGLSNAMWLTVPSDIDPAQAIILRVEALLDGLHSRLFFQAKLTGLLSGWFGLCSAGANANTMEFIARAATASGATSHFVIDSVSVYNTCPV